MDVIRDEAMAAFEGLTDEPGWAGVRLKDVRSEALSPGGRARLTFFERVEDEGRPHPRLRASMPPAVDPSPPTFDPPTGVPGSVGEAAAMLRAALDAARPLLQPGAAELAGAPKGSERYFHNSVRTQRTAALFDSLRRGVAAWIRAGALVGDAADGALLALRALEDEAYAGEVRFDDADTGAWYGYDAPFVSWLERLLASLPEPDGEDFAVLAPEQQTSVERQREQAQAHLDWLMRHKVAVRGVRETDIERTVGGLLIDRRTRLIVSEVAATADSLVPEYELLHLASGPHEGEPVYRDGARLRLQDGAEVPAGPVESEPVDVADVTFLRAPDDPRLRAGARLDWDGDGWVRAGELDWVGWAGHCDVKATLEQLGVTLSDGPTLTEHRTDTGQTTAWSRELLLEALSSMLELGSLYRTADGEDTIRRGIQRFGGARNDSLPDRLQLRGVAQGRNFRWPIVGRQDSFRVTSAEIGGARLDLGRAFYRHTLQGASFVDNPAVLEIVDDDCAIIDVSGAVLEAEVLCDVIDELTGAPRQERRTAVIDLGAEAGRSFLGTHLRDAARREVYRVTLDRGASAVVAELERWQKVGARWVARPVPELTLTIPLQMPLRATLSRETKRDDPALYQTLLGAALRQGQDICADTDMRAPVWNGKVTRIHARKVGEDAPTRTERWRVDLTARFGDASLEYLVRRGPSGEPEAFTPVAGEDDVAQTPDFLWQDFPDVGSKGVEGGRWVVNEAMLERDIVVVEDDRTAPGGIYVQDDHVKNTFEVLFAALGGYPYTIVHDNKRWGFRSEEAWRAAVDGAAALRGAIRFQEP